MKKNEFRLNKKDSITIFRDIGTLLAEDKRINARRVSELADILEENVKRYEKSAIEKTESEESTDNTISVRSNASENTVNEDMILKLIREGHYNSAMKILRSMQENGGNEQFIERYTGIINNFINIERSIRCGNYHLLRKTARELNENHFCGHSPIIDKIIIIKEIAKLTLNINSCIKEGKCGEAIGKLDLLLRELTKNENIFRKNTIVCVEKNIKNLRIFSRLSNGRNINLGSTGEEINRNIRKIVGNNLAVAEFDRALSSSSSTERTYSRNS